MIVPFIAIILIGVGFFFWMMNWVTMCDTGMWILAALLWVLGIGFIIAVNFAPVGSSSFGDINITWGMISWST